MARRLPTFLLLAQVALAVVLIMDTVTTLLKPEPPVVHVHVPERPVTPLPVREENALQQAPLLFESPAIPEPFHDGMQDARNDIHRGLLKVLVYGGPPPEFETEYRTCLKKRFGIREESIASCVVEGWEPLYASEYNSVSMQAIETRGLAHAFSECHTETIRLACGGAGTKHMEEAPKIVSVAEGVVELAPLSLKRARHLLCMIQRLTRAFPAFQGGQPAGFAFIASHGGLMERLNVRKGDVIRKVNGAVLTGPVWMSLLNSLRGGLLVVEVERSGTPWTLQIPVGQ